MKILYGHGNTYINITKNIFNKCITDDGIYIPSGDENICNIIGYDPYPYILKHILIEDAENTYLYSSNRDILITFDSIHATFENNPKIWWNSIGKFIPNPVERLNSLHKHISLKHVEHGGFQYEYPEQLMAMKHIHENSKVLEIGGNIGRVSHIIQTIIDNPKNHVILECNVKMAEMLRYNLNLNTYTEVPIETSALSHIPLYMDGGHGPRPIEDFKDTEHPIEIPTISYSEICKKYNIDFDVLIADCEGSLFYIFKDHDMLNNIHTVIMENDYYNINHKIEVDSILRTKGFTMVYQEKGVPWASWSCCYEYFYEVWKK